MRFYLIIAVPLTHPLVPKVNGKQCGVAPSQDSDTLFVGNICRTWTKEIVSVFHCESSSFFFFFFLN